MSWLVVATCACCRAQACPRSRESPTIAALAALLGSAADDDRRVSRVAGRTSALLGSRSCRLAAVAAARPNLGHRAVAALQQTGVLGGIITQNVDGLPQAAGARDVVELHGALDRVVCLECGTRSTRDALDERLRAANPDLDCNEVASSNPDGDAELTDEQVARFRLVGCECCGADLLKPDVVFFGENVPRPRVQRCFELVDSSACLLVLGSSLTVMSGLRFVHRARQARILVAIVNRGVTRGDPLADIKVDAALGEVLPALTGAPR